MVGCLRHRAKGLTFSNISVITEDILLETQTRCLLSKGELIPVGPVTLKFLTELCPFLCLEFSLKIKLFTSISVFAEDIYLKLGVVICYKKGNPFQ